jgi:hypothetical protein
VGGNGGAAHVQARPVRSQRRGVAQYVLAVGRSDVTDVVVNTAGGLAGIGLLALAHRRLQARTAPVVTRFCLFGTVLALLAVGIVVASPLHYAQRGAAVVSAHSEAVQDAGRGGPADHWAEMR